MKICTKNQILQKTPSSLKNTGGIIEKIKNKFITKDVLGFGLLVFFISNKYWYIIICKCSLSGFNGDFPLLSFLIKEKNTSKNK